MNERRRPWNSLKVKLALLVTVLLGAALTVLSVLVVDQSLQSAKMTIETSAKAFAELSTTTLGNYYNLYYQSGYSRYVSLTEDVYALQPTIERVQIVSVDGGRVLADSSVDSTDLMMPPQAEAVIDDETVMSLVESGKVAYLADNGQFANKIVVPYVSDFGQRPFSLVYEVSYESADQMASQARWLILAAIISIGALAVVLINWAVGRAILRPFNQLIGYTQEVAGGNLKAELSLKTGDELEDLAEAVESMSVNLSRNIEELKELNESKNEFLMIASHNLRTPLTALKGYLPLMMESGKAEKSLRQKAFRSSEEAVARLNRLIEQIITIITLRQQSEVEMQPVELRQVVAEAMQSLQQQVEAKRVTIEIGVDQGQSVLAEKKLLTEVLVNVVDNAIKFSEQSARIEIRSEESEGRTELKIIDYGIGMSAEQVDGLFQMFHRQTSVLDYDYEGLGLGLYISRLILTKFRAWLHIDSQLNQGTVVTITFPKSE